MMKKFLTLCAVALAVVFGSVASGFAQEDAAKSVALTPVPVKNEGWQKRFAEKNEQLKQGDADILIIGDSITHGWDGRKQEIVKNAFGDWKVVNLGISGDRTEHVLWRLENAPLNAVKPKAIMLMIGTNNIGHGSSSSKEAAAGVVAIVEKLQATYPTTPILVLEVFARGHKPYDPMRRNVDEINDILRDELPGRKNVTLFDLNGKFLLRDGTLPKEVMGDFLHPGDAGYMIWGSAVHPILKRMAGE